MQLPAGDLPAGPTLLGVSADPYQLLAKRRSAAGERLCPAAELQLELSAERLLKETKSCHDD